MAVKGHVGPQLHLPIPGIITIFNRLRVGCRLIREITYHLFPTDRNLRQSGSLGYIRVCRLHHNEIFSPKTDYAIYSPVASKMDFSAVRPVTFVHLQYVALGHIGEVALCQSPSVRYAIKALPLREVRVRGVYNIIILLPYT